MATKSNPQPSSAEDTGRLRLEIEHLRSLANTAIEGLAIHKDGVIVVANDVLAFMVGRASGDELVGTEIFQYAAPQSRATIVEHMRANTATSYEVVGQRADGSQFPV
jgi:hypothetical protein